MDDIAGLLLALRQIVFSTWVGLNEQKWSTLGERRGRFMPYRETYSFKAFWLSPCVSA
ncbi:hypothetical protein SBA4_4480005 [Candidatus Sulfopaludibacter sp. SbA4]|nr:hypothetical protein SBA4_4480005 [Candidatus Sulfopaludibacter sp. SbA4]